MFYPSNDNPYAYANNPAGSVPSHQSSSQSSGATTTSYTTNGTEPSGFTSVHSEPNTTPHQFQCPPTPVGHQSQGGVPASPSPSQGSKTGVIVEVDTSRVPASPLSEKPTRSALKNKSAISGFKREIDTFREAGAYHKALSLLDKTCGGDVPATSVDRCKSNNGKTREQSSKSRALTLLEAHSASTDATGAPIPGVYMVEEKKSIYSHPYETDMSKERMATSTRKPKEKTAEDVRDPETVAGMKDKAEIEREKRAKQKALFLMKQEQGACAFA